METRRLRRSALKPADELREGFGMSEVAITDPTPLARSLGGSAYREVRHHWGIASCPASSVMVDDATSFADATACMCVDHRVVRACTETASRDSKSSRRAGFHDDLDRHFFFPHLVHFRMFRTLIKTSGKVVSKRIRV